MRTNAQKFPSFFARTCDSSFGGDIAQWLKVKNKRRRFNRAPLSGSPQVNRSYVGSRNQADSRRTPAERNLGQFSINPDVPLSLNKELFVLSIAELTPSGSTANPRKLRVCLDDEHVLQLLPSAAEDFARGETPASRPSFLATMTALRNKDGGVRGITTGSSFRRLVAKTLARQFGQIVEQECAPFHFTRGMGRAVGRAQLYKRSKERINQGNACDAHGPYEQPHPQTEECSQRQL